MARDPRQTARDCFALAARATIAGERNNALERGMAILNKYGLDPDDFDIPGRERPQSRPKPHVFERPDGPPQYAPFREYGRAADAFSQMAEAMRASGQFRTDPFGGLNIDDLLRESVAEAVKRRRAKAAAEGMFHATQQQATDAIKAELKRRAAAASTCRHGRRQSECEDCMAEAMQPQSCKHGTILYGTGCVTCQREAAEVAAKDRCQHGLGWDQSCAWCKREIFE